jgi:putative Ca2+/H+ antiporter (TMEM165/GDT1 family)
LCYDKGANFASSAYSAKRDESFFGGATLVATGAWMDLKLLSTVAATVFLAELGDKTQLATLLFAAESPGGLWAVFLGAAGALILASAIGVLAGGLVAQLVNPKYLTYAAGIGFIVIGIWTLAQA